MAEATDATQATGLGALLTPDGCLDLPKAQAALHALACDKDALACIEKARARAVELRDAAITADVVAQRLQRDLVALANRRGRGPFASYAALERYMVSLPPHTIAAMAMPHGEPDGERHELDEVALSRRAVEPALALGMMAVNERCALLAMAVAAFCYDPAFMSAETLEEPLNAFREWLNVRGAAGAPGDPAFLLRSDDPGSEPSSATEEDLNAWLDQQT